MKTILTIVSVLLLTYGSAQVSIGKDTVDGDGILDFANGTTKGLLLPRVITPNAGSVPGVLVLEATDKALILPKVADPHTTIKDPEAGMIAYDTTKKMLCVFNGTEWAFWGE